MQLMGAMDPQFTNQPRYSTTGDRGIAMPICSPPFPPPPLSLARPTSAPSEPASAGKGGATVSRSHPLPECLQCAIRLGFRTTNSTTQRPKLPAQPSPPPSPPAARSSPPPAAAAASPPPTPPPPLRAHAPPVTRADSAACRLHQRQPSLSLCSYVVATDTPARTEAIRRGGQVVSTATRQKHARHHPALDALGAPTRCPPLKP